MSVSKMKIVLKMKSSKVKLQKIFSVGQFFCWCLQWATRRCWILRPTVTTRKPNSFFDILPSIVLFLSFLNFSSSLCYLVRKHIVLKCIEWLIKNFKDLISLNNLAHRWLINEFFLFYAIIRVVHYKSKGRGFKDRCISLDQYQQG